jgi:hypothetical protein
MENLLHSGPLGHTEIDFERQDDTYGERKELGEKESRVIRKEVLGPGQIIASYWAGTHEPELTFHRELGKRDSLEAAAEGLLLAASLPARCAFARCAMKACSDLHGMTGISIVLSNF